MRGSHVLRSLFLASVLAPVLVTSFVMGGCKHKPDSDPEWMNPPKAYQPKTADLTFNEERLKAFNTLGDSEREAFVEQLKGQAGQFKGQAIFKSGAGLGEKMENSKYGEWELTATTDPVLFEITLEYSIFTTPEIGRAIAPNRAIEFTGTMVELDFKNQDKPRRLVLKVKADQVGPIEDK